MKIQTILNWTAIKGDTNTSSSFTNHRLLTTIYSLLVPLFHQNLRSLFLPGNMCDRLEILNNTVCTAYSGNSSSITFFGNVTYFTGGFRSSQQAIYSSVATMHPHDAMTSQQSYRAGDDMWFSRTGNPRILNTDTEFLFIRKCIIIFLLDTNATSEPVNRYVYKLNGCFWEFYTHTHTHTHMSWAVHGADWRRVWSSVVITARPCNRHQSAAIYMALVIPAYTATRALVSLTPPSQISALFSLIAEHRWSPAVFTSRPHTDTDGSTLVWPTIWRQSRNYVPPSCSKVTWFQPTSTGSTAAFENFKHYINITGILNSNDDDDDNNNNHHHCLASYFLAATLCLLALKIIITIVIIITSIKHNVHSKTVG